MLILEVFPEASLVCCLGDNLKYTRQVHLGDVFSTLLAQYMCYFTYGCFASSGASTERLIQKFHLPRVLVLVDFDYVDRQDTSSWMPYQKAASTKFICGIINHLERVSPLRAGVEMVWNCSKASKFTGDKWPKGFSCRFIWTYLFSLKGILASSVCTCFCLRLGRIFFYLARWASKIPGECLNSRNE